MTLLNGALDGPLLVLLVMLVLGALLRWTFSEHERPRDGGSGDELAGRANGDRDGDPAGARNGGAENDRADAADPDFGLLVSVATVRTRSTADGLRARLAERGLRSTIAPVGSAGAGVHILVFREDAATAERLLGHLA